MRQGQNFNFGHAKFEIETHVHVRAQEVQNGLCRRQCCQALPCILNCVRRIDRDSESISQMSPDRSQTRLTTC